MSKMDENLFDVIVLGTGLVESITAAALSKAGYKVAHIDRNKFYGGDHASLSLDQLATWVDNLSETTDSHARFLRASRSQSIPPSPLQYAVCLQPALLCAAGPFITSLIASGVAKYSEFQLLDAVCAYDSRGRVHIVPGSKEDIFKSKEISLIEKRRLMRFLMFAAGEFEGSKELEGNQSTPFLQFLQSSFSLSDNLASVIAFALSFCASSAESTLPVLVRLRQYIRSRGRYGPSPFLLGHYGGIGDIAQGFCRAAAVSGGVYITDRNVISISRSDAEAEPPVPAPPETYNYSVQLADFPETLHSRIVISPSSYLPPSLSGQAAQLSIPLDFVQTNVAAIARCIAILDHALSFQPPPEVPESSQDDENSDEQPPNRDHVHTGLVVFPPSSVENGSQSTAATALICGEKTMSSPSGKWILYIALPLLEEPNASVSLEALIQPYLDALLSLSADPSEGPIQPLSTTFYLERQPPPVTDAKSKQDVTYLIPPPLQYAPMTELADYANLAAEHTFQQATKILRKIKSDDDDDDERPFWPPLPAHDDEDDDSDW